MLDWAYLATKLTQQFSFSYRYPGKVLELLLNRSFKVIESYAVTKFIQWRNIDIMHVSQIIQLPTGKAFPVLLSIKKKFKDR